MLFILMAVLCCGEYKVLGQESGSRLEGGLGEEGPEADNGFFCRTVQWDTGRRDW